MLLKDFIVSSRHALSELYPEGEARSLVDGLCGKILGVTPQTHILQPGFCIDPARLPLLEDGLSRLLRCEPLQYVLGEAWFLGRRFKLTPAVLIPRPETEEMVDMALRKAGNLSRGAGRPLRVLDLCTGSGCIAWSMALGLPQSEVTGLDISPEALSVASSQFDGDDGLSGAETCNRPRFVLSDVLDPDCLKDGGRFDIFLSNPPYVRESEKALMSRNVLDWEPGLALFVPDGDPLRFYRAEAALAARLLSPGGFGLVEINEAYGREVAGLFRDAGFRDPEVLKDLSGRDRFVLFSAER